MDSLNTNHADDAEGEPRGYAVAMTEAGMETLKRIPNLEESGIKIVEAADARHELWTEEDRRLMEILPLAEKQLDDMIARYDRSAKSSKELTIRLNQALEGMRAAADRLRTTLEKSTR
jgi:hypothetical protein